MIVVYVAVAWMIRFVANVDVVVHQAKGRSMLRSKHRTAGGTGPHGTTRNRPSPTLAA